MLKKITVVSDFALIPLSSSIGFRPAGYLARFLRVEAVMIASAVLLPIPAFALTGASIPLPATLERVVAALTPWSAGSVGQPAQSAHGSRSTGVGIQRTAPEIAQARDSASARRGAVAAAGVANPDHRTILRSVQRRSARTSPHAVHAVNRVDIPRVAVKPAVVLPIASSGLANGRRDVPVAHAVGQTSAATVTARVHSGLITGLGVSTAAVPTAALNETPGLANQPTTTGDVATGDNGTAVANGTINMAASNVTAGANSNAGGNGNANSAVNPNAGSTANLTAGANSNAGGNGNANTAVDATAAVAPSAVDTAVSTATVPPPATDTTPAPVPTPGNSPGSGNGAGNGGGSSNGGGPPGQSK